MGRVAGDDDRLVAVLAVAVAVATAIAAVMSDGLHLRHNEFRPTLMHVASAARVHAKP